jgi:hypothetical protein
MTSGITTPAVGTGTVPALKEWGAVACALLDGRQTVLLRKGGIHEKAFDVATDRFVLFPTVAHSHAERVRSEHRDLLAPGAGLVDDATGSFTVSCGVSLVDVIAVERTQGLRDIADLHIWTDESVRADRVDFRPKHRLQVLVVRAVELPRPLTLRRVDEYGGCRSWVDLPVDWDGTSGRQAVDDDRLVSDAGRVRAAVA